MFVAIPMLIASVAFLVTKKAIPVVIISMKNRYVKAFTTDLHNDSYVSFILSAFRRMEDMSHLTRRGSSSSPYFGFLTQSPLSFLVMYSP